LSSVSDAKVTIASYRGLLVWQKAMDLVVTSYQIAKRLPAAETYMAW